MFQTIVGGIVANLTAVAVVAGVATATGLLHISFSWSWKAYLIAPLTGFGALSIVVLGAINLRKARNAGASRSRLLWLALLVIALTIIFTLVSTFFMSIHISINHGQH
jgi:hypothetical protein